ncbi:MAG: hypothetical protein IT450_13205 [Phycisphaerales bacterium]|nr:hypothetical protein [Phycisphaerales bacterium]
MRVVELDEFESPFSTMLRDARDGAVHLHKCLHEHAGPDWVGRALRIEFLDNRELNASTSVDDSLDVIRVNLGTLEHIYGLMYGLLSTPSFLPSVGDPSMESTDNASTACSVFMAPMPLLKSDGGVTTSTICRIPVCPDRGLAAHLLADLAIQFMLAHEIGHLVAGHCNIAALGIDVPTSILEIDADMFACHCTAGVHTCDDTLTELSRVFRVGNASPRDAAFISYLCAVAALFRAQSGYVRPFRAYSSPDSGYPHPAVRSYLIGTATIARGFSSRELSTALRVIDLSTRNLEDVWGVTMAEQQLPDPIEPWVNELQAALEAVVRPYLAFRGELAKHSRVRRAWDDWTLGDDRT